MQTYRPQMEIHHYQPPSYFQSCHNLPQLMYINNIIMAWDSPQCIHDLISVISGANRICYCTVMIINFLPEIMALTPS